MANPNDDNPNAPETHDIRINAKQGPEPNKNNGGGSFLTKKMGPLPLYGWVIVAIAGYVLIRYYQNKNASSSATTPDSGAAPSGAPLTPDTTTTPDTTATTPPGTPLNNEQWLSDAETALKRLGYSPQLIQTSLQRYLAGEQLDAREEAVVETAINLVGHPPIAGTFGQEAPPPTHPPHPKKPPKKRHLPPQVTNALGVLGQHHMGNHRAWLPNT